MSDGFVAKYRVADISDHLWERSVAVIRRTRSYQLACARGLDDPELVDDLDDESPRDA